MPIAKNIKYCRKKAGLTQQNFADEIGVSKATINAWENKKSAVPVPSVKRVANFFSIDFTQFCDIDLENLEHVLSGSLPVHLTEQETRHILMFRELPEDIKQIVRYVIVSAYERNVGGKQDEKETG